MNTNYSQVRPSITMRPIRQMEIGLFSLPNETALDKRTFIVFILMEPNLNN